MSQSQGPPYNCILEPYVTVIGSFPAETQFDTVVILSLSFIEH